MLKFHFSGRILTGFLFALVILSCLALYSYQNTQKLISSSHMVAHTHDVLYNAERVLANAGAIEIGQRGYALTGDERFLTAYTKSQNEIAGHVDRLRSLTVDNQAQQERIRSLQQTIDQLVDFSASAIAMRKVSFEEAQRLNATMKGKQQMDAIRSSISDIEADENQLLHTRIMATTQHIQNYHYAFLALLLVTGLILVAVFYAMNVTLKQRIAANDKLQKASEQILDLYNNAPCGYHSLNEHGYFVEVNKTLLRWLGYEREEILGKRKFSDIIPEAELPLFYTNFKRFKEQGYIHNLEFSLVRKDGTVLPVILSSTAILDAAGRYIKSRTITVDNTERKRAQDEINLLNKELESFSYSVSHDLRAPLRSIDGYTRILQEDYGTKLDGEAQRLLNVITNNAKRMGLLIDDLLDFSRLGRKDMLKTNTDMNGLVHAIAAEFQELEKRNDRSIDVKIRPLESAPADVEMMRQVWINLISNAVKYTGKNPHPRIEISSSLQPGEIRYEIRDNGVGFDMQYVEKLFGVFQRLHKMQEFSGTGVGLAIVKRIVNRHHGKVWAEGRLNEGATFYFTIPTNGKQ
jgi:PAS domain S-box-containing protein